MQWSPFLAAPLVVSLASLLCAGPVSAQPIPSPRRPIPGQPEQSKAKELLREIYKDDFSKATKPEQKSVLASKFLADAIATNDAPVERYVLLKIASDVAVTAGNTDVALRALDEIARDYEVDGDLLRLEALEKLAASAQDTSLAKATELSLALNDKLTAADRYAEAVRAAAAALQAAKRSKSVSLVKVTTARNEAASQLAKDAVEIQAAAETLKTSPTDKAANLALGKFYCFGKQDWERGLPMLALGNDEELAKLGKAELVASTPAERIACADQWFDLSQTSTGPTRAAQRRRAYNVYSANVKELAGLTARKVESRLTELGSEFNGATPPAATVSSLAQPPKVEILHVFRGHRNGAISPDSRLCVTADEQGVLHLWSLPTLQEIRQFKASGGAVRGAITFSSDSKKIVTTAADKKAYVWDVNTGAELQSFEVQSNEGMNFIWLSPDGKRGNFIRRHLVWSYELEPGRLVKEHNISGGHGETWFRSTSSDGKLVASGGFSSTVRIFDLVRGAQVTFDAPQHAYAAALSPDGKFILYAGGDPIVRLRNVANVKQVLSEYKGAEGHVYCTEFSADGKAVLAGGSSQRVLLWDLRSAKLLHTYEIGATPQVIKCSPNGWYALVITEQGSMRLLGLPK